MRHSAGFCEQEIEAMTEFHDARIFNCSLGSKKTLKKGLEILEVTNTEIVSVFDFPRSICKGASLSLSDLIQVLYFQSTTDGLIYAKQYYLKLVFAIDIRCSRVFECLFYI